MVADVETVSNDDVVTVSNDVTSAEPARVLGIYRRSCVSAAYQCELMGSCYPAEPFFNIFDTYVNG